MVLTLEEGFRGFSPKTLEFLMNLDKNNHHAWFDAHRQDYENYAWPDPEQFNTDALRTI